MRNFIFKVGSNLISDGRPARIVRMQEDGRIQLELDLDGSLVNSTHDELLHQYAQKRLQFIGNDVTSKDPAVQKRIGRSLHTFPEHVQDSAIRKKKYLDFVLSHGVFNSSPAVLQPIIAECARVINCANPPSAITVWRWYRSLTRCHQDYRALIDRHDFKGGNGSRLHPSVQEIVLQKIEEIYLTDQRNSGDDVYFAVYNSVDKKNEFLAENERLRAPSKATIYRAIADLDKYEETIARFGSRIADMKFRTTNPSARPQRVMERVEIDHTPLDLFVIDADTGLPHGRPTVTVAIDVFSKMPVGIYIGFAGTSIEAVFACLKHAVTPKSYVKDEYPEVDGDWPCHGHIEVLVCDNGLEFHSQELARVALELGTNIQFCPKRKPYYKGSIERFLKTVNYKFARELPGHSFAKWFQREDYDPLKDAVLTLDEFKRLMHRWLIDVYAKSLHRGINTTPYQKWADGAKAMPPKLLTDLSRLDISLGRTEQRSLFQYGLDINNMRYNDRSLLALQKKYGKKLKVDVRYFFGDISMVYVIEPTTKEAIPVPAVDQQYTQGLNLEQHRLICARVREINKGIINIGALARAKAEIREIVYGLSVSKMQRKRQRAAKINGVGRTETPKSKAQPTPPPTPTPSHGAVTSQSLRVGIDELPALGATVLVRS